MPRKPKFRPKITQVKLNPEQAVLQCDCYSGGYSADAVGTYPKINACSDGRNTTTSNWTNSTASS